MSSATERDPTRRLRSNSAAGYQTTGIPGPAHPASSSRGRFSPSAPPTHASPDAAPFSPTIPRKEVGSGIATGLHPIPSSLEPTRTGATNSAALEPSAARTRPQASNETAERLDTVIDLGTTVDTEIITKEAPAVVHEKIIPRVHEIREEAIEREIHKHHYIHRVLPVIDVEVLPPRHFVPAPDGSLVEVTADQLPGRLRHWEIIARPLGTGTQSEPLPFHPELGNASPVTSTTTTTIVHTEHGDIPRTETVIRHPPTISTVARDVGQSWPLRVVSPEYAEKHDLPRPARAAIAQGTMKPLPQIGNVSAARVASPPPANANIPGSPLSRPGVGTLPHHRDYSPVMPGDFSSTVSTTGPANYTFPEPPLQPPPPPPKD